MSGSLERGRIRDWQEKPPPCWCFLVEHCCAAQGEVGSVLSAPSVHCHRTFQAVVERSVSPGKTHIPVWQIGREKGQGNEIMKDLSQCIRQ